MIPNFYLAKLLLENKNYEELLFLLLNEDIEHNDYHYIIPPLENQIQKVNKDLEILNKIKKIIFKSGPE